MDIIDSNIVRTTDGRVLMSLSELSMTAQYNPVHSEHLTAESTYTIRNNAYSFGCTFAEVEVDIPMCKVKLLNIVNVHDCGKLINPALAEAQVHGGMSMGIGYGLSEQLLFDEKTGRPLNNNLLDYKLDLHGPSGSGSRVCGKLRADVCVRHQGAGRAARLLPGPCHPQRHLSCDRRRHRPGADHAAYPLREIHRSGSDPGLREVAEHV